MTDLRIVECDKCGCQDCRPERTTNGFMGTRQHYHCRHCGNEVVIVLREDAPKKIEHPPALRCPKCDAVNPLVTRRLPKDTFPGYIVRAHKCQRCGYAFQSHQST